MPELAGKRERFCMEYLKDVNATKAYVRAGYTSLHPGIQSYRLMCEQEVQDRIAELAHERSKAIKLDANDIIVELLRMLTSDPLNYVDEEGRVLSLAEIPIDARRAIASFEVDTMGSSGAVVRTRVKFWSKEKAAELLGKHLTLFKDVLNIEGLEDLANMIIAARARAPRTFEGEGSRIATRAIENAEELGSDTARFNAVRRVTDPPDELTDEELV